MNETQKTILLSLKAILHSATVAGVLDEVYNYTNSPNTVNDFCDSVNRAISQNNDDQDPTGC